MLKFYPSWFVFFLVLILGVGLVASSNNWFTVWVGFELLLLGFLPMFTGNSIVIEGMIKYFLIQAGGSSLFLVSFMGVSVGLGGILFVMGMVLKLGLFPFYNWVPMVMSSLSWVGCLLLSTVQKVAPLLMLLLQRNNTSYMLLVLGGMSVLVSGVLGYNQTYMRSLMGYSSIAHTGWLVVGLLFNFKLFLFYFLLYSYMLTVLFFVFSRFHVLKVVSGGVGVKAWAGVSLLMLVLAGVPPFSLFFMKAAFVYYLSNYMLLASVFIAGAVLSVYYYLIFIIPNMSSFWSGWGTKESNWLFLCSILGAFSFPLCFLL